LGLKVIIHDINPRDTSFAPSAPASAYFVSGTKTSASSFVSSTPSDTPGGLFVIFQTTALDMLTDGLMADKVMIAFARKKAGADVVVSIDTTVADTDGTGARKRTDKIASRVAPSSF
jgi:hypothetical protein